MPNFFDEVDASGIVENHIKDVLGLEHDQAEKILSSYEEIRKDLVDRLSRLPKGTFTAQHIRGTLAQIEGAIGVLSSGLHGSLVDGASKAGVQGVDDTISELSEFDEHFSGAITPININAALVAQDVSSLLVTKYKSNLDQYGKGLLNQIQNGLFSAAIGEATTDEVVGRISRFFKGDEWKLTRIVRTELHHIYNLGKLKTMQESDDEMKKTLVHPMDARTGKDSIYAAQLGLVADLDKPFAYKWAGQWREFMVPPDRPNDRSALVPYKPEWGRSRGEDAFLEF